jgi:hypothetical protein
VCGGRGQTLTLKTRLADWTTPLSRFNFGHVD